MKLSIDVPAPTPDQVQRYLTAHGWLFTGVRRHRETQETVAWHFMKDEITVIVPKSSTPPDYEIYVTNTINILSASEERPFNDIYNDMMKGDSNEQERQETSSE